MRLYQDFDGQYIDGSWRPGKHGSGQVDTDPYSGATLAETITANQADLDEAYHAAAKEQVSWAARPPAERAAVMLRSASKTVTRHFSKWKKRNMVGNRGPIVLIHNMAALKAMVTG